KFPFGVRHLAPFGFYFSLLSLGVLSTLGFHFARMVFFTLAGIYVVGSLVAALHSAPSARCWRLLVVFWLMHSCYAAGTMVGFFAGRGSPAKGQLTAPGANPVDD